MKAIVPLERVVYILQDDTSVRWTANELVDWLNDAQVACQALRPDSTEEVTSIELVPGAFQDLGQRSAALLNPSTKLIGVTRNTAIEGRRRAIRLVSRQLMDAVLPNWESSAPATDAVNYMTDPNLPNVFWVYPPAPVPSAQFPAMMVEVQYSATPTPIQPMNLAGKTWRDIVGDLSVKDRFMQALVDFVLYRAYLKDSEYGGNGARAQTHFQMFQNALMADQQGTMLAQPKAKEATM
jgi:hypothetical protein